MKRLTDLSADQTSGDKTLTTSTTSTGFAFAGAFPAT